MSGGLDRSRASQPLGPDCGGNAEIGELGDAHISKQNILGLDVSMHHALTVGISQRLAALLGNLNDLAPGQRRVFADDVFQIRLG